jgi:hypothetical protein
MIVGLLAGAAVLLAVFVVVERRISNPLLDLSLFANRTFTGASIVAFVLSAAMFSMFLYLTLYMQGVLGYGPLDAGLRFLPITLLSFFVAPLAGRLSERLPARGFFGVGLGLIGLGLLLMRGLEVDSGWTALLAGFVVAGIGIGLINPPLASTAIGVVEPRRSGMASGINSTFRQVGIATGIAALGAVFQARVEDGVSEGLTGGPGAGLAGPLSEAVASGAGRQAVAAAPPALQDRLSDVTTQAFVAGLNDILLIGAVVALVGAVLAVVLVRSKDLVARGGPPAQAPSAADGPEARPATPTPAGSPAA